MADLALTFLTHLKNGPINNKATFQRTNYPFNSFCKFNGNYYGAAASTVGLCKLGGDLDISTKIDAYFIPITTDFGTQASKRNRYVNIEYNSSGDLYSTITPNSGTALTYNISGAVDGLQRLRFRVAEKPKGVWWTYKFGNVDGAYFLINRIDIELNVIENGNKNF